MHDHYTYLPSIGIAIMLAWGIPLLFPSENIRKKILFPAGIAVISNSGGSNMATMRLLEKQHHSFESCFAGNKG